MEVDGGAKYYLKPMNCPFHILVYRSRQRSYRDLPLRLFEFGTVYRYEKSGVVHGLTRARGFTQDDAHIFCTREEMRGELVRTTHFVLGLLRDYGLNDFYLELSTKPAGKAIGSDEEWDEATDVLRSVSEEMGLELVMDEGGGAFYGPKISVQARDAIGRSWQMSTIQLDFNLPRRFELEYVGADNARHRPIMIHRALFGSVERFMAVLIEHYAGALPTWLSPEQVRVLPVSEAHAAYAESVREACADGRPAGQRRRRRGQPEGPNPQGQADQGSLHFGRGAGRCRRRDGRRQPALVDRQAPARGRPDGIRRRRRGRSGAARLTRGRTGREFGLVSLENLWAGWRHDYIQRGDGAGEGRRLGIG